MSFSDSTFAGGLPHGSLESEIASELEAHLELFVEDRVAAGMDPEAARAEAERRFGDRGRIARACLRETKGDSTMNRILLAALAVLVLFGAGMALMTSRAQLAQAELAQALSQEQEAMMRSAFFRPAEPVAPEEIKAFVGGTLRLVDRHGSNESVTGEYKVQRDGHILLPDIGWVSVAGKSRPLIERELNELLSQYYAEITLDVVVEEPLR